MNGLLLFWKLYIYDDIVYSTGREIDHQLDSYVPTASSDPSSFEEVVHSTWQDHWLVGYVYMKTKKFRYSTPVDLIFMQNDTQWKFRVYDKEEPQGMLFFLPTLRLSRGYTRISSTFNLYAD